MLRLTTVGVGAAIAAVAGVVLMYEFRPGPPRLPPRMPGVDEVERITAWCLPFEGVRLGTDEFPVPPEYLADLLRVLGTPEPVKDNSRGASELAVLRLLCRGGREVTVRVYFWGKEPARYSIDGVHCLRSGPYRNLSTHEYPESWPEYTVESLVLSALLRQMSVQPLAEGARRGIADDLATLDRSAGR